MCACACAVRILSPLPVTTRGMGLHIDANASGDLLCYASGPNVVVRSVKVRVRACVCV